jgi:hypothetical protein
MTQQNTIRISCPLFIKLFLVKEAQLLEQGINDHINGVFDQCFGCRQIKQKEFGLIGYFLGPILKDRQSELPFTPGKALIVKFANYRDEERARLLERALCQYVLLQLCNKTDVDLYSEIAIEILEDLAHWDGGTSNVSS